MIDILLCVMALIWGTNYTIVKSAFREVDPQAFNAVRMAIASCLFLWIIGGLQFRRWRTGSEWSDGSLAAIFQTPVRLNRRDVIELALLGFVGHFLYQSFFIGGLALTTVANSSLMLAATPVVIALISALIGQERVSARHWAGAALSMIGIYVVVGEAAGGGERGTIAGDLMMAAAVICWALYTLGARRLISRHSPVGVTGLSMAIGTLIYIPVMWPHVRAVQWHQVSSVTWLAIGYSAFFALCVAYTIWYAAVRQIGSARTSVYSNVIPLVAMATAVVFLGEPLSARKILGAISVLVGVALTRTAPQAAPPEPCEP
jgi:drug/metabolite transporter (DMT)-like permease